MADIAGHHDLVVSFCPRLSLRREFIDQTVGGAAPGVPARLSAAEPGDLGIGRSAELNSGLNLDLDMGSPTRPLTRPDAVTVSLQQVNSSCHPVNKREHWASKATWCYLVI